MNDGENGDYMPKVIDPLRVDPTGLMLRSSCALKNRLEEINHGIATIKTNGSDRGNMRYDEDQGEEAVHTFNMWKE